MLLCESLRKCERLNLHCGVSMSHENYTNKPLGYYPNSTESLHHSVVFFSSYSSREKYDVGYGATQELTQKYKSGLTLLRRP